MHILTNAKPIPMLSHGTLEPGEWLCHDVNAAELLLMGERGTSQIRGDYSSQPNDIPAAGRVVLIRSGAIGDLLYLSPVIAELKRRYPDLHIALSCFPKHHEVVCDLGVELLPYPLSAEKAGEYDVVLSLEDLIERNHSTHATDCFAEYLTIPISDYRPVFILNEFERAWGLAEYPKKERRRVGLQCRANVLNRDYRLDLWMKVIEELAAKYKFEVFLFGSKDQLPPLPPGTRATNLTERSLTFRQSASILATCDAFCGVDSAFLPLCHALDIPAVGLYAAFDWKTRTAKAPKTFALTGVGECAPCSWHRHAGRSFPPGQKCAKENFCNVLASITPERIVGKIAGML